MKNGLNKVQVIGNLGKDPETRFTPTGKMVCQFSVAVNRTWTASDGEKKEHVDWFNIDVWGSLGEICQKFLRKGRLVYIEGRLSTREYEADDGSKRWFTSVVVSEMKMLDRGQEPVNGTEIEHAPDEMDFVSET